MENKKNPYEIRLDVLNMAKDLLMQDYALKRDVYLHRISTNSIASNQHPPLIPTASAITEKANELYNFVATTSNVRTPISEKK